MKITLTQGELLNIVKRAFPEELIPADYMVVSISGKGYNSSSDEFEIYLKKKEEEKPA